MPETQQASCGQQKRHGSIAITAWPNGPVVPARCLPFPPAQAYAWAKLKTLGSAEDDARRRRSLALLHCLAGRIRAKQRSGSAARQGAARMAVRAELQHLSHQAEPRARPVRTCAVARLAQRPARTRARGDR